MKRNQYPLFIASIFSIILLVQSCAINPVTGKKQIMFMTEAQEVALGAQYDPSVVSTFGVYDSPELLEFITNKGNEIAKISHRPNLEFHYKILDTPVINAFAVPGGYVYFTRGILAQFNNEAELVGVLGHEIGHVTARHSVSQQSKQQIGNILLTGGIILAPEEFRPFAEYAMQGMQLLFLKFSRDNESESDRLGVEYSSKIGYDAHKMADFFNVLNKMQMESDHAGVPTFMSTHPDPGDRFVKVNEKTKVWQDSLKQSSWKVNADSYLKMVDGIVYGEDPRQGFLEENTFYHPALKFKYPVPLDWDFVNSPMQVQMAPKDGKAMMVFFMAQQKTLDEAAQFAMEQLKLEVLESKHTTVNNLPALVALSQQVTQNQQTGETQTIKALSYLIQQENNIYVFHGVAADADFNSYLKTFESTMANFNRLTDPSKLNVQPDRIKIRTINSASVSLSEALKYYKVPESRLNEFALLNNMELDHILKRGDMIKTIGN